MQLSMTKSDDRAMFTITGNIDEEGAEVLKKSINQLQLSSMKEITFDMKDVMHIGSTGIGKMLLFYKNLGVHGGKMSLINLSPPIYDLFTELKLNTLFEISKA